ncbi:MAG: hypothetical protein EOP32_19220 [Rhodococcus sp. (in: high G+C Gram-positive bacteria)]|nr:MAG: hypothetical protein EOP32_19220 [Rhodococcus sp. (in: high G+C Gram-positive bacteria)]
MEDDLKAARERAAEAKRLAERAEAEANALAESALSVAAETKAGTEEEAPEHVEPDGSADIEESSVGTVGRSPRSRALVVTASAMAVLILACVAISAILIQRHSSAVADREREAAIIESVREDVTALIAPTFQDAHGSAQKILDGATGDWASQFEPNMDAFAQALTEAQVQSSADISEIGIERHNDDGTTDVLVAATSKVTNSSAQQESTRAWRLRVNVALVDGEYKLAKVDPVV